MSVGIIGIGHFVPPKVLTNHDLEKMVETSDQWIQERTGIRERRLADKGVGVSQMAIEAAKKALASAMLAAGDVELLIVATTTPDMPLPSTSCIVQKAIQAKKAVCFDLSAACAGFVFAMSTAQQYLSTGKYKNALVIGADKISPYIDWKDRSTCILFGDAAGACVMGAVKTKGIFGVDLGSDGNYANLITIMAGGSKDPASKETIENGSHYLKMNGAEVFKLAVRSMLQSVNTVLDQAKVRAEDIRLVVPHQANMRIIEALVQRLKIDRKKVYVNLDRYGNTSAASVIVALSEAVNTENLQKGDLILLTTFGSGLVWGSAVMEWSI
jgi:3-oxoacyl-[acyl-carrier-protein] synthase III